MEAQGRVCCMTYCAKQNNLIIRFCTCLQIFNNDRVQINSLYQMCQVSLQFIAGCVQSSSNEITLLETDSPDYITVAQMQYAIASVRSAEISGFDSKAFFKFMHRVLWTVACQKHWCCALNESKCLHTFCTESTLDWFTMCIGLPPCNDMIKQWRCRRNCEIQCNVYFIICISV